MEDQFIPVLGYEPLYTITLDGTVRNGGLKIITPRIDKRSGYLTVCLSKGGIKREYYVHRLVGVNFVQNPDQKPILNHKDGNRLTNHRDNLEWTDHSGNIQHAYDNGLIDGNKGGNHHRAQAVLNEETGELFGTIKEAARSAGINYHTLRNRLNTGKGKPYWKVSES